MSVICGDTSCAMSLSPVEMSTLRFCFAAAQASVPMTSSASTPVSRRIGRPMPAHGFEQRLDLRAQVVGHRRAMRLVLGEQLVAEGLARGVEHDRDAFRVVVLEELREHVEHAEHRAGRFAARIAERRQRVERAIQIRRAVDEDEIGAVVHALSFGGGGVLFFFLSASSGSPGPGAVTSGAGDAGPSGESTRLRRVRRLGVAPGWRRLRGPRHDLAGGSGR